MIRFCDESAWGFGWLDSHDRMRRTSHALLADGLVWIVDPVNGAGVDDRIRALGKPGGVVQLLDRHTRDCAAFAARFGVPHHLLPLGRLDRVPFDFLLVRKGRFWKETGLWWEDERVLCVADALGTLPFFCAPGETLGVHPLLRLIPPRKRLGGVSPCHVLCGHGEGLHGDQAGAAFREALSTARRRLPRVVARVISARRPGARR